MKILRLELLCTNLQKAEQFYTGILGFKSISSNDTQLVIDAGTTQLVFTLSNNSNPVYHFAFNIPCNKFDEAFLWAEKRLNIIDVTPNSKVAEFTNWHARSFYFFDTCGNILEFIARFDMNNQSVRPFESADILCVSEIGIVTNDVTSLYTQLNQQHQIPVFDMQPPLQNFAALGNNDGLLILSAQHRHWYPTNIDADRFFTRLVIENNSSERALTFNEH